MKTFFRKLFMPLLKLFEQGEEPYHYKPMNRKILLAMGALFCLLAAGVVYASVVNNTFGYALPVIVFSGAGLVCFIVGALGSERAVAKIWGNK